MSVKSPDNDTTNTEFSSLLSRHPELAEWLTVHSQQEPALSTEEVYRLFLEECTHCGISNEEYPFAVEDNGKSDLLGYYRQLPQRPMELPADVSLLDAPPTAQETEGDTGNSVIDAETAPSPPTIDAEPAEIAPAGGHNELRPDTQTEAIGPAALTTRRPLTRHRVISLVLLGIILLEVLIPIVFAVGYGINAYRTYTDLRDQAHDGVQHLLNIKTIFTGIKTHPTGFLDTDKLHRAERSLTRLILIFSSYRRN